MKTERLPHLFCFGLGYSAVAVARRLARLGWRISGTCRNEAKQVELLARGFGVHLFERDRPLADPAGALASVTHLLSSVPPDRQGDPVLDRHAAAIRNLPDPRWIGYLSTTGVYGDTQGTLVDESAPVRPSVERSVRRVEAERRWLAMAEVDHMPVHVFRLAGIYGPGRSTLDQVRSGQARRIRRPGHLFSRIHVDDIAAVLQASIDRPNPGRVYNVCDDAPAEPAEVVAYACELLGREPPPLISWEEAAPGMSAMAMTFWQDNRRVDNGRIKRELGVVLRYPSYREGLAAIAAAEARSIEPAAQSAAGAG